MEINIPIENPSTRSALYGTADKNLRMIRAAFDVRVSARDGVVHVSGKSQAVSKAAQVLDGLQRVLRENDSISDELLSTLISEAGRTEQPNNSKHRGVGRLDVFSPAAPIQARGEGQQSYIDAMSTHDLTFCVGPAGSGKTFLAVAAAVSMLKQHRIKRLVLARPAVEAGERLGFLPGDMQAKVNPYLRPLFDAMNDMMTFEQMTRFIHTDVIEVIPLAFMRGRTFNNAFVILDEAQNASASQMLMLLTRLGHRSKMVVTGDVSQSDLPDGEAAGIVDAVRRLEGIEGIAMIRLLQQDIVRHPLVQRVVEAYSNHTGEVPKKSDSPMSGTRNGD